MCQFHVLSVTPYTIWIPVIYDSALQQWLSDRETALVTTPLSWANVPCYVAVARKLEWK